VPHQRVDEGLDVDGEAEVDLDDADQRFPLYDARLVGVAAARDEGVDCSRAGGGHRESDKGTSVLVVAVG